MGFTNTMINKGNSYEHVNDMATMFAKMMYEMKNRNHNNYNTYSSNSHHGDRLVEKLAEQKHHMEAKIGNMTCVMRELNVLDASNNIDVQAMKRDIQKYTMPSEWFKNKYEHRLDTCY